MAKYIPKLAVEPIWDSSVELQNSDLSQSYQWYNQHKSADDSRNYLISYLGDRLSKDQKTIAKTLNETYGLTEGWTARILSRGAKFSEDVQSSFDSRIQAFIDRVDQVLSEKKPETNPEEKIINLQDRVRAKSDFFIAELEGVFDQFWMGSLDKNFDPYKWLISNEVKSVHANRISDFFSKLSQEMQDVVVNRKKDDYLRESYPKTNKEMALVIEFLDSIVVSANRLSSNKSAERKPRKKKVVSVDKKISKLNYKKSDPDSKLQSINPAKILGAEKLWIYNVKTRKLGVYIAEDKGGLDIKGSTLLKYKYEESIAKTVRKPEEVLPKVLDGGKIVLRKLMGEIKAKAQEMNGRINSDTILLRVE